MSQCSVCRPALPCIACINQAKREISHGCDGPLTDFVVISRGCRVAASGKVCPEAAANAITEVLQELGFLPQDNPMLLTGT